MSSSYTVALGGTGGGAWSGLEGWRRLAEVSGGGDVSGSQFIVGMYVRVAGWTRAGRCDKGNIRRGGGLSVCGRR